MLENSRVEAPLPGVAAPPAEGVLLLLPLAAAVLLWRIELMADVSAAGTLAVADASADEGLSFAVAVADGAAVASDVESSCSSSSSVDVVGEELSAVAAFVSAGAVVADIENEPV